MADSSQGFGVFESLSLIPPRSLDRGGDSGPQEPSILPRGLPKSSFGIPVCQRYLTAHGSCLEEVGQCNKVCRHVLNHICQRSLGKGSQGNPLRPIRDHEGLLGLIWAYWEDLAPLPEALMAYMIKQRVSRRQSASEISTFCFDDQLTYCVQKILRYKPT